MKKKLSAIIVTGASGIVGRSFLEAVKDNFLIYAIARRSQKEAGIANHPNIRWIQVDIGNWISLRWIMHNIKREGGVDFILHLAGYYDFDYTPNLEYERTNIKGTKYMLEQAKILRVKRFIFASSSAASNFPEKGGILTEKSVLDAEYDYARSKKEGEKLVKDFSKWFPCSIVRFAAVFTDWCEYGPLYVFLSTWLRKGWNTKILGGKGESAVPYIHSTDLNKLIIAIINPPKKLPDFDIYLASPDGSTSHKELFNVATKFFYGKNISPIFMPKFIALPGVILMDIAGRIFGKRPFERPWMLKYLDKKLNINSSYTREALNWAPTKRLKIERRLLYLIEKMKSNPAIWHRKNKIALKRDTLRPNILIYNSMIKLKETVIEDIKNMLLDEKGDNEFSRFRKMDRNNLNMDIEFLFQLLAASVRTKERILLLDYARELTQIRFKEGFQLKEISIAIIEMGKIILSALMSDDELKIKKQMIYDYISISLQMTIDEIEDTYEKLTLQKDLTTPPDREEIEQRIEELEAYYNPSNLE